MGLLMLFSFMAGCQKVKEDEMKVVRLHLDYSGPTFAININREGPIHTFLRVKISKF